MKKKEEKKPFVSREAGAKFRQQARGGNLPGVVEVKTEVVTPVATAKTTAELYLQKAKDLLIDLEQHYAEATEIMSTVKNAAKLAELEKNKVLIPAEQVVKAEKARWKPIEKLFEEIDSILRPRMKKFLDDKEAKAREELAKLQSQIDSGHIKKASTIAQKEDAIYSSVPAKTIHTGSGSSSARKIAKLKIVNRDLIPDQYWVIDEVKLRADVVTKDMIVPGAEKVWENSIAII
jgi:hypothetical protein